MYIDNYQLSLINSPLSILMKQNRKSLQRFDLVSLASIFMLTLVISIVLVSGDRTTLRVVDFSWGEKQIGVQDRSFTLTFNRPMDRDSVEQNLQLKPFLPGKISWSGLNLSYTLTEIPIYGEVYKIKLEGARELKSQKNPHQPLTNKGKNGNLNFSSQFSTRDRAFAYIGIEGKEKGRLILYNITKKQKTILTPADLSVVNFEIYPDGDTILFSAFERGSKGQGFAQQQLYNVTTGINFEDLDNPQAVGRIKLLLDAKEYQNIQFSLSADGKTILIQRANRLNPIESGLWIIAQESEARPPECLGVALHSL
ncbi:MAG: hypothetical protein F6K10_24895, partial [Moorea sp. SIO2B7]|nr:hypothetical protein [Moorena sp. SIO2B7]